MEEKNRQELQALASSIKARVKDFLSDLRNFETMMEDYESENDDSFPDAKAALDECLSSVSDSVDSLGEAEFALQPTEDDEEEE